MTAMNGRIKAEDISRWMTRGTGPGTPGTVSPARFPTKPETEDLKDLLDTEDWTEAHVARHFHKSVATVRRWCQTRHRKNERDHGREPIPMLPKIGRSNHFNRTAVLKWGARSEPSSVALDLLMSDGKDLRSERLTDRKHELRRLISKVPESRMRYVEHIEQHGTALFERVCRMDLEGIVAKHSFGNYVTEHERTTWFKIKNRNYSQMAGREKLFERERHREPVPGWHCCDLACAEL